MARRAAGPARSAAVRPRYGRIISALVSMLVTAVALLGASGVLPVGDGPGLGAAPAGGAIALSQYVAPRGEAGGHDPALVTPAEASHGPRSTVLAGDDPEDAVLPADSGQGRRVVFSMSAQRAWLVEAKGRVQRTYLVSGSRTDNLEPGTYEVYSTSRKAIGIDDSGTMNYMVRFAHGRRAAIGFHDIPVKDGRRLQTRAELGTPQSSGCIRQARPDAEALWDFAPVGTTVVVLA